MKRTILALAIAGLSFAAYASPPPGGGPPGPIDVNVTNPVVPVEVSNADPVPVAVVSQPAGEPFAEDLVASCEFSNVCTAQFPAVPSSKWLRVTNIRFVARSQPDVTGAVFAAYWPERTFPRVLFPSTSFNGAYFGQSYAGNYAVDIVIPAGGRLTLEFGIPAFSGTLSASSITFGATGYLMDASP
jgi:hypothetical protein